MYKKLEIKSFIKMITNIANSNLDHNYNELVWSYKQIQINVGKKIYTVLSVVTIIFK